MRDGEVFFNDPAARYERFNAHTGDSQPLAPRDAEEFELMQGACHYCGGYHSDEEPCLAEE